jgi:hypothetical protein
MGDVVSWKCWYTAVVASHRSDLSSFSHLVAKGLASSRQFVRERDRNGWWKHALAQFFYHSLVFFITIPDNVCLAFYYRLVVQHGVTEIQLRKYAEPLMHLCAMGFGIVTAAVSVKLTLFNNADLWCWIASFPFNCTESFEDGEANCTRGDDAYIFRWAFFYGPLWLCMVIVLILNVLMYWHVKIGQQDALDKEAAHFAMQDQRPAWDSSSVKSGQQQIMTSVRMNKTRHRRGAILSRSHLIRRSLLSFDALQSEEYVDGRTHERSFKMVLPETIADRLKSLELFCYVSGDTSHTHQTRNSDKSKDRKHSSTKSADIRHVLAVVEDYPSAVKQYTSAYIFGTHVVASQCLAYTVAFFLTWIFPSVNRIVQQYTDTNFFGLLLCQGLFEPLQGLFNVLVYRYAFYLRLKTRNPHLTRWELIISTLRWTYTGPPPSIQDRVSLKMAPTTGRSSLDRHNILLSPSARSLSVSKNQGRGSGLMDLPPDSKRDSEIRDDLDGLTNAVEENTMSVMANLMMDYFDNPSLLNQNMVSIQSDFPLYISDTADNVPTPGSFPVQVSFSTSELPLPDFPTPTPLEAAAAVSGTEVRLDGNKNEPDASIVGDPNS